MLTVSRSPGWSIRIVFSGNLNDYFGRYRVVKVGQLFCPFLKCIVTRCTTLHGAFELEDLVDLVDAASDSATKVDLSVEKIRMNPYIRQVQSDDLLVQYTCHQQAFDLIDINVQLLKKLKNFILSLLRP